MYRKRAAIVGSLMLLLATTMLPYQLYGQTLSKSFDNETVDIEKVKKEIAQSEYSHIGFTPTYSKGIKGMALDLTPDVAVRIPLILVKGETPAYDKSFSLDLWVKTKKGARQGTPIMSNKKHADKSSAGWTLGTADDGAWYFNISDGKNSYDYYPTARRQAINDGCWHHLVVSVDMQKAEIWFYFDGENVAIYNTEGMTSAQSQLRTVIGGSDEYTDWGSRGEWVAFNGMIDEVNIHDRPLQKSDVKEIYTSLLPDKSDKNESVMTPQKLKVQVWNIWHGGHRFGEHVGLERTIDVLKSENADVIGLIETYGSGAIIADSLGYYFYLISSNLSIMSRYPIEQTIKVFKPFFSGGALLDLGQNQKIAFFDIWLNYAPDACTLFKGKEVLSDFIKAEKDTRLKEVNAILKDIKEYTENADNVPVFVVGDFNIGSHLDWTERTKELHYGMVADWQVSRMMAKSEFKDSFREMNPDPLKDPGFTWSPLINNASTNQNCIRDRIDFIYYKGSKVTPYRSRTIENHLRFWPSDHGSVITWFYIK